VVKSIHVIGRFGVDLGVEVLQGLQDSGLQEDDTVLGLLDLPEELVDFADIKVSVTDRKGIDHKRLICSGAITICSTFLPIRLPDNGETLRVLQVHNFPRDAH